MSNKITKTVLLRSTIIVGAAAFALPAFAQSAGTSTTAPGTGTAVSTGSAEAAQQQVADNDQVITVTGSLIKNPNLVRSTPVTVTTADEISLRQSNVAEDVLREIPGVVPSVGSAVNNGNGGASYVDLRGLGSNRNIVLLDGNRIVPAGTVGRVDLNNIPLALINRVESLTGAASTTYGADAVSGVVNFITKQDFSGIDVSGSEQITGRGDGNYYRTDLTVGGNFAGDKGNAVLSIGYQHADPVYQGDRTFSAVQLDSFSGAVSGSSTSVPTRFSGTRPIDPATGLPSTDPTVANNGSRYINPTTGLATIASSPFNFNPYNVFQTPFNRYNIYGQAKYDISDKFEIYTRGLFSKNTVSSVIAPSGIFGTSVVIPLSNPYLPAGLRGQFCAANQATPASGLYSPLFTPAQCTAAATATSATDPNYRTVKTTIQRRLVEGGSRIDTYTTQVFDYRLGARGSFSEHLNWDINGSYGESENRQARGGYTGTSRVRNALLATNPVTCLDGSSNCVPLNIFGPSGSITPVMAAYISEPSSIVTRTTLAQAHAQVGGDFGLMSPFGKDPISFAVGTEYRKYTASQDADVLAQTAGELGGAGGAQPTYAGGYNVVEGFGELIAPIVQDKPFFENLTLEAGARYSSYKVNAPGNPSYKTTTYKGGGSWEPGFGLKVRGNYSHAVRAPNIAELFLPVTVGLTNLATDPCASLDAKGVRSGPAPTGTLAAVCLAQGATPNNLALIQPPTGGQANVSSGGNPNVKPENADTFTVGGVYQPSFFRGFSVTVDYYKIKITNAITTPTPGDDIGACFNALSATNPACLVIRRDPVTGRLDGDPATTFGLFSPLSNLGKIATDGIDLTANYSRDVGFAKLGLSLLANYTFSNKFQATPTSINRECVGYYSVNCGLSGSPQPKFQFTQRTTLGFDSFDISLLWRHIDSLNQEPQDVIDSGAAFGSFGHIKAYNYFDLSGRVNVAENLTLTLTVQNLADRRPPVVGTLIGATAYNSGNTYPSTYDALGRRFAITARVRY